jgi:DNA-binding NarL/FixJ family response regulator
MRIGCKTVRTHACNIREKTHVHSRSKAALEYLGW